MNEPGRVLVLDRHAPFRRTALAALRGHGVRCDGLGDPREAAERLRRDAYDVLVLDVGSAANRRLLVRAPSLSVVAITGRRSVEGAVAALRVRAVDYLAKPIRIAVLRDSVRRALEKAAALRGIRRAERLIALCAQWTHWLDAMLAGPGTPALPSSIVRAMTRARQLGIPGAPEWHGALGALSPREHEVLVAFASGLRVRQIARSLGVSVHTARAHLKAIMRKLNVHSQVELLDRLHVAPPVEDGHDPR